MAGVKCGGASQNVMKVKYRWEIAMHEYSGTFQTPVAYSLKMLLLSSLLLTLFILISL